MLAIGTKAPGLYRLIVEINLINMKHVFVHEELAIG